ncbi:hypothetical protein ACSBR2_016659 [Camellia fascicularis]
MEHLTMHLHRPRTTRSPLSFWGDGGIILFEPFFFFSCFSSRDQEIGSSRLKNDLRVSRVGPGWSLNAFFFILIVIISKRLAMVRKKEGTSTLRERSTTGSYMLRSGRMNRSQKGIY